MDLEGFTRRRILKGSSKEEILEELDRAIGEFKDWDMKKRRAFSKGIYEEVRTVLNYRNIKDGFLKDTIEYPKSGVAMGEFGVGSRGEGDFFVHRKISEIIGETNAIVDSSQQDDAGVVRGGKDYITVAVDGMHSRLSDFPFLAGFHAARAALRDVYVMGSKPVAMVSDMHLADDGDVGKIFDFTAGVSAVSKLTGVPLVTGSTLRIGGDMVFGDRLVTAIGAVGISNEKPKARKNAEDCDVILLTEGKGGGTITTVALYHGHFDLIKETMNVEFMEACERLIEDGLLKVVHAMTDITNGGIRGDAKEISENAGKKLVFREKAVRRSVNKKVLEMLEKLKIDYLGISTDSLMLILPRKYVNDVKKSLEDVTKVYEVGRVEKGRGVTILGNGERPLQPLFRESPYTKIKMLIGEDKPGNLEEMKNRIEKAKKTVIKKRDGVIRYIKSSKDLKP